MEAEPISTVQCTNEYVQQCESLFPDIPTNPQPVNKEMKQEQCVIDMYLPNPPKHTLNLNNYIPEPNNAQDFAIYLIHKELVSTGLLQFDDKPENYWAWKTSFISLTQRPTFVSHRGIRHGS